MNEDAIIAEIERAERAARAEERTAILRYLAPWVVDHRLEAVKVGKHLETARVNACSTDVELIAQRGTVRVTP
jgi:hypothetical protein